MLPVNDQISISSVSSELAMLESFVAHEIDGSDIALQKKADALIRYAVELLGQGNLALVSSFGAEAAVLLHLVSRVDKDFPILFLETGKHFQETLDYVETLKDRLRLTNVKLVSPNAAALAEVDPDGELHKTHPDQCCDIRKVQPLAETLKGYRGWITGRKRFHGGGRSDLPMVEAEGGQLKINPLVEWSHEEIQEHFMNFALPHHELVYQGYTSIGCEACTHKPEPGDALRSGRWQGKSKFECGIHRAA